MSFKKFLPLNVLLKKNIKTKNRLQKMNWLDANNEVNNEHFKCKLANKNTSAHPCMQPVHVFHRENKGRDTVIPSPIIEHNQWKKIDITILLGDTNLSRS